MTFQIECGDFLRLICPVNVGNGAVWRRLIVCSSMLCSGFCEQELLGVTYRRLTENGALFISDFVAGEIKGFGKGFWKRWWMSRISSGS